MERKDINMLNKVRIKEIFPELFQLEKKLVESEKLLKRLNQESKTDMISDKSKHECQQYIEYFFLTPEGMKLQEQLKIHFPELMVYSTLYIPEAKLSAWYEEMNRSIQSNFCGLDILITFDCIDYITFTGQYDYKWNLPSAFCDKIKKNILFYSEYGPDFYSSTAPHPLSLEEEKQVKFLKRVNSHLFKTEK